MKKTIILLFSILTLSSFNEVYETKFNIIGKWKAQENNEIGFIIFDSEGYAYFEFNGLKIGGKEFIYQGKKGSMRYEVKHKEKLMEIDLIVTVIEEKKTESMLCIAEKINKDEIKLAIGFEGVRPNSFENNESMIFKRVKE